MNVLVPVGSLEAGARIALDALEVHHLRVRRAARGESVRLLDGAGGVGDGVLELGKKGAVAVVGEVRTERAPRPLVLAIGAGERDRFAWVVEKAAELGVTEIVPLETEHTRGVASRIRSAQVERFRRRTLEAIKQCGATWAPQVREPVSLEEFAARAPTGRPVAGRPRGQRAAGGGRRRAGDDCHRPRRGIHSPRSGGRSRPPGSRRSDSATTSCRFETAALAGAVYTSIARKRGLDG